MSATTIAPSARVYHGPAFWERLWRLSGINAILFVGIAYALYGSQPSVGAPPEAVAAFYTGNSSRILIAVFISGMGILNLLWFVAALRTTLADAGLDGWGTATTIAGTMVGGLFFLLLAIPAALASSSSGDGSEPLQSGLNTFVWSVFVLTSFPRAMLVMAPTFALWRARLISNGVFAMGVAAVVLVLLGGTTWLDGGFWAPDGIYSRLISPLIGLGWVAGVSQVLVRRTPATRAGW